jgi:AbrB family looped-hinge helix DNA binding protein
MNAIVSEKGQVTIPKQVRETLGIRPGTVLEFEAVSGKFVGEKKCPTDVFRKWRGRGSIPGRLSVDTYLKRVRE